MESKTQPDVREMLCAVIVFISCSSCSQDDREGAERASVATMDSTSNVISSSAPAKPLTIDEATDMDSLVVASSKEITVPGSTQFPGIGQIDSVAIIEGSGNEGEIESGPHDPDTAPPGSPPVRSVSIGQHPGDVIVILDNLSVSTSQVMVQQTPVDTQHGYLYTANIEPGPDGDTYGKNLLSVVRQGTQNDDGSWSWKRKVVEDRTIHDRWHTAPSVAADADGAVHVVYNMHNFPWQYKRSTKPHDIDNFEFRGQAVSIGEIDRSRYENKTTFPDLGTADIPGNQITYPAFYKDRSGELYATYRFAAKPKRRFAQRTMSGGIARYDRHDKTWQAIGGNLPVSDGYDYSVDQNAPSQPTLLAGETGWTIYHPRLMFGPNNELNVNWFWRSGTAGAQISRPCFVRSRDGLAFEEADGSPINVPVTSGKCGNMGFPDTQSFFSIGGSTMDSSGKPHVLLSPDGMSRQIASFDASSQRWILEKSPQSATEIFVDGNDNLWAVRGGKKLMVRYQGSSQWKTLGTRTIDGCYPKATVNETGDIAYIHSQTCDEKQVTIYGVRLY